MSVITTIADQINEEIRLAEQCMRTAVEHAWNAGRLLTEQKANLQHGEWLPWLDANVNLSPRRAQEWMDLASSYARAPAHSTIEEALKEARHERRLSNAEMGAIFRDAGAEMVPVQPQAPLAASVDKERLELVRERKKVRSEQLLAEAQEAINLAEAPGLSASGRRRAHEDAAIRLRQASVLQTEIGNTYVG